VGSINLNDLVVRGITAATWSLAISGFLEARQARGGARVSDKARGKATTQSEHAIRPERQRLSKRTIRKVGH
jgi:hypothetical protein